MVRLIPVALVSLALGAVAPAAAQVRTAVGVCLHWGASPDHVEDVVIVVPSGNPVLDAALPDSIRQMQWRAPNGPGKRHEWLGVWMSVDGAPVPPGPPPSCAKADDLIGRPQLDTRPI
jgi:hypothetical protein